MIDTQAVSQSGPLSAQSIQETLAEGLSGKFSGKNVLVLIPLASAAGVVSHGR
jgi:hypothetical protein